MTHVPDERGYAMAALLVSIAVLMVVMSVAMPVWRTQAKREKEAELIFRGEQYARAINLYTRKMGPGNFPPSIDVLVQQRFLRKKFKDPMTENGEFDLITAASAGQAGGQSPFGVQPQPQGRGGVGPSMGLSAPPSQSVGPGGSRGGSSTPGGRSSSSPFSGTQGSPFGQSAPGGGIMGVRSKSKEASFRIYNGGTHYNEWQFMFAAVSGRPGGGQGGPAGAPGGMRGGSPFSTTSDGRGGRGPGGRGGMPPPPPPGGFGPGVRPMGGRGPG